MSILPMAVPHMEELTLKAATKKLLSGYENTILQNV